MKFNRIVIIFVLLFTITGNSTVIHAIDPSGFQQSIAEQSLERMHDLDVFDRALNNTDQILTREILSRAIVTVSGFADSAISMRAYSSIIDVKPDSELCGYINMAVEKGLMNVMADDRFYPMKEVTYAQACTIMVRALGYANKDIAGVWPANYINMAERLGLTTGIVLEADQQMTLGAAAIMLDRLLDAKVKPINSSAQEKEFHDQTGLFNDLTILDNSTTSDKLTTSQVLTDRGIYYTGNLERPLELGNQYRVRVEDSKITKVFTKLLLTEEIAGHDDSGKRKLPKDINYFYRGTKLSYNTIKDVITNNSTIVLAYEENKSTYKYGVIYNPLNSKPETITAIILGNSRTSDRLSDNQLLTDRGIFYCSSDEKPVLGSKYRLVIDGDTIVKVDSMLNETNHITVETVIEDSLNYYEGIEVKKMILPKVSTTYYYHGIKQDYNSIKSSIQTNSVIILARNESKIGYEYGIIVDPVYSAPAVNDWNTGSYSQSYGYREVIYQVTDMWGQNVRTITVDNKISGQVTGVYPNKMYPTAIQVGGKSYELSKYYDFGKTSYFNIGLKVTLILGYDGKVIDIY